MKKNYTPKLIVAIAFLFSGIAQSNAQTITLTPSATGSEADALYTDASTLQVNASGVVSYYNSSGSDDWTVSAETITQTGALNKTFTINWGGMATVNTTEGSNYGKMLTAGGIDRDGSGLLGIRGTTNGIDNNEGYYFGFDLSNLGADVAVQITKISVAQLAASGETGIVVSLLDPAQRINFGNSTLTGGAGTLDVSSLHLYVAGGSANSAIVSVFNNTPAELASNWRITKLELKVVALSSLPVGLASFTATTQAQGVKLQWETLSEQNNKEFTVLRSSDGSTFTSIATLPGAGSSNTPKSYGFYDRKALNGINYYKLVQVDNDGKQTELGVKTATFNVQTSTFNIFPNPTDNEVNVLFQEGIYHTLALTNMQGKLLQTTPVDQNATQGTINLRHYTPGIYLVKLQGEGVSEVHKLIKR
ncbi:T9SS type A sorting domain-containing protein [Pedobacter sp. BS3]|uniref:T9SS type A sorting domain-containing protein n=1 Tax=Pedobacter sp. BS3 TaxID=2567937 RepID=UPI0011EC8ACA|nr:T9SS type A sorting domain-containing protein [Pedobacter sp. BS3]TZF83182.1 T9SS type A sorting domain-containing protein [Pedobacter sp. BS3]